MVNQSFERIAIKPWPSETPLKVAVVVVSLIVWLALIVSIFGIIYAVLIGLFLFATHLLFVATVRGNAVRIGPNQYPELYSRVEHLCRDAGLGYIPETYVMQAGGALNALATKFLRSRMIIIFSDLLDACENDEHAQEMIIGHEIGHIRRGHLDAYWFLLPGLWVPFLGAAYSRAREYTCDRYGYALAGDRAGALKGLAILSAGKNYGRRVNYSALVKQRETLDTGFMTLGTWLMSHPPVCDRMAALDRTLAADLPRSNRGRVRALLLLGLIAVVFAGGAAIGAYLFTDRFASALTKNKMWVGVSALMSYESAQSAYFAQNAAFAPFDSLGLESDTSGYFSCTGDGGCYTATAKKNIGRFKKGSWLRTCLDTTGGVPVISHSCSPGDSGIVKMYYENFFK
jgi:Zn-dependent protease with chaperone function